MLISHGMMFIFLLASLQWIGNYGLSGTNINSVMTNTLISTGSPPMSGIEPSYTTVTTDIPHVLFFTSTISKSQTTRSSAVQSNTESNSMTPSPHNTFSQITHQPVLSTKDASHSSINSRISLPPEMHTTSNDLSTTSENDTATTSVNPRETASNNFTTTTHNVNFSTMVPTKETRMNSRTDNNLPVSTTFLTTKSKNVMTDLRTNSQTPSLHHNFTDGAAESKEAKENHNNGGVVFGAIVGAVLGSALICLVGYFMCGKRKSESFAHQRLYDDTRNDPVLRLDNAPEPYGVGFGDLPYYNPMQANETSAHDAIPMDDMTSTQPST